ncbi:MAG: methylamine utilization protein [Alphaproteobacteria bacterium]|nr:methylamine utilization protein [Alphaproteobacteria bacterium]
MLWLTLLALPPAAPAAEIVGTVTTKKGAPVPDAIIYAAPASGTLPAPGALDKAIIDQFDKMYFPFVSAIRTGTEVSFPNRDDIKHHLYSVSPAKTFERSLYSGNEAEPLVFDKIGEVTLGCNIHDWMIAHVLVLDTPYSAVTDETGVATIPGLPADAYDVKVWHPGMKGKLKAEAQRVSAADDRPAALAFTVRLRPKYRWWRDKPFGPGAGRRY